MPRGVYVRKPRPATPHRIVTLGPDDPLPEGPPRRYMDSRHGYVRLRWKVGTRHYVEIQEHRAVLKADDRHVHHLNHNPSDNREENLVLLTPSDHAKYHGRLHRRFDRDAAAAMYLAGDSTPQIAHHFGVHHVTIYRGLVRAGVRLRTLDEAAQLRKVPLDSERLVEMHRSGMRAPAIASALGTTREVVRGRLRDLGETPHRVGRPEMARLSQRRRGLS